MKITAIRTTPLLCKFKQPYHWSQGINYGAPVILIEVETDTGIVGIGEATASPVIAPVLAILQDAIPRFIGQSAYDGNRIIWNYYQAGFNARGTGSAPRYFSQALAGIELALWDAIGKAAKLPLHKLLGGAVRDKVEYFGFVQGDTPDELASHASDLSDAGFKVLYVKVGRGAELDVAIVSAIRTAVGPGARLRLDANEVWDQLTARRMFEKLEPFDIEFIEQPIPGRTGSEGLARLRAATNIPIAADQTVYCAEDAFDICRNRAADVIVLGIHETCGVVRFRKAAAVAEAAAVNICLHGVFETGITTCASNQVAATIPNMDDGNQIMWQLLAEDIVKSPNLVPKDGALPIVDAPGLGFELDRDAVNRAAEAYRETPA
ncbi:MAG: mandelate racemase/muconate lactonizing enzyme family protein [Rhizobiales bacterium]|nr:mandelate racemase/muconate lactonizing enzyme family protein [Hyphomicrobiales bacterium]